MLKNKISAIQIHQIMRFATTILVGIIFIKAQYPTVTIGELEGLLFVGTTMTTFVVNGWIQTILSHYSTYDKKEQKTFLGNSYLLLLLFSTLIFSILCLFNRPISLFLTQSDLPLLPLFGGYLWLSTPTFLLEYFLLLAAKNNVILRSSLLTFCLTVASAAIVTYAQQSLEILLYYWIGIAALRHLFLHYYMRKIGVTFIQKSTFINDFLKKSLPFLGIALLGQYAVNFDAWLINYHYKGDATAFAIFRYGARELPIFLALATGLSNGFAVRFAKEKEKSLSALLSQTKFLMHVCFSVSLLLLATSTYWFPMIFSKAFESSIIIFDIYLLLIISRLLFPQAILTGLQASSLLLKISIAEVIFNIVISIFLINTFGMTGVAAGTFLAFLFEKIMLAIFLKKHFKIAFSDYTPTLLWLFYSGLMLLFFTVKYFLDF
jgi:O-antigen/teichoic acid export membrane protein